MRHAEAEDEAAAGDGVQRERALRHLHRMLVLDRQHRGAHLDPVDLAHRHGKGRQQVTVERHLRHPDPSETLVARGGEGLHQRIDRRAADGGDEVEAHSHATHRSTRVPRCCTMTTELARLQNFGPNWFASVMGTGIVATAGVTLPVHVPGLRGFSHIVWVVAAALLVVLVIAVTAQWARHPTVARSHARNPQMSHFYGAAPMALMTVGAGALLTGKDLIGERMAVDLTWVLWSAGTLGGLFTAATIPFLMFTQLNVEPDAAFGGWLMPVVPPMVSAASGALLIPHMAPGTGRTTMLYGCYAMFGLSLVAALIIITMIWSRLAL